jgi:hypothetical protein
MAATILNLIGFQIGWFACVLGAARGWPWLGPILVTVVLLGQVLPRPGRGRSLGLLVAAGLVGYAADSALVLAGVIRFSAGEAFGWPSPLWMVALWVNFAGTLNGCLTWLRGRYLLAALLGLAGGPFAYYAGARLGAVALGAPIGGSLAGIAVEWAVAMPFLLWMDAALRRLLPSDE